MSSPRNWRLLLLIVILAWLVGLLLVRSWQPEDSPLPEERQVAESLPMPELSSDLDPEYRVLMEEALEASKSVVEVFPEDADATATVALLHHLAHDKKGEERCWRRCLELDPQYVRAFHSLATRATDDGNYLEAEALMRQAMAAGCEQPEFPTFLATALMQQGKLEEAAEVLEEDIRKSPHMLATRVLLGQIYSQLEKYEQAKGQFEAGLVLSPTSTHAYLGLASACDKLGLADDAKRCRAEFARLKEMEQEAEKARQKKRKDELLAPRWVSEVMTIAGQVYSAHGRLEDAERLLVRAAELDSNGTECRESLAAVYDKQGRHEEALRVVKELGSLDPNNLRHIKSLAVLLGRLGRLEEAEAVFRELCRIAPQQAVGYAGLAEVYLRAEKKLSEARSLASEAVRLQPTAWNYLILGSICEKLGDDAGAEAAAQRAAAIQSGNPMSGNGPIAPSQRP